MERNEVVSGVETRVGSAVVLRAVRGEITRDSETVGIHDPAGHIIRCVLLGTRELRAGKRVESRTPRGVVVSTLYAPARTSTPRGAG
jgi:hypothetical protein